ncbi:hypothetical protein [uncultured Hyphomonas sp.]|uniref:hypothetical protein n=1 Tax=uncultured Hyphomonas sp. TaxID=225298 RepID=UPI002AAA6E24|nr:hypothetical protein [uncultured Hyphomonas sp.]
MHRTHALLARLIPAAVTTAGFAAIAHAALVAVAARSIGMELVYIAGLSFVVALVVALIGGAVLLAIVRVLRLGLISSLLLFLVAVQAVAIWLQFYFFEFQNGWADISWQYGLISVPASLVAWHRSVFYNHKRA